MPTSLSSQQREVLAKELQVRIKEIRNELRNEFLATESTALPGEVHDRGDEAAATGSAEVADAVIQLHLREIEELEAALQQLHSDTYGCCADCGVAIGYGRLRVYPTATRCRDCQSRVEHQTGLTN